MKKLFYKSYGIWLTIRLIIIVLLFLDTLRLCYTYGLQMYYLLSFIFCISNLIIVYREQFNLKKLSIINFSVGFIFISVGLVVAYLKFTEPKGTWGLSRIKFDYTVFFYYGASIILILLGINDFTTAKNENYPGHSDVHKH